MVNDPADSATALADTNADGIVGLADFNNVENNFGLTMTYTPPPGGALGSLVPEPGTIAPITVTG